VIPKLFWGFWNRIFDNDGLLREEPDPNSILFLRQLLYVAKKVELECSPKYLFDTTKEFFHVESTLPIPTPIWECSDRFNRDLCGSFPELFNGHRNNLLDFPDGMGSVSVDTLALLETVQQTADRIASSFGLIHPEDLLPRHGPGVVSDRRGEGDKFEFPLWSSTLLELFPYDTFGQLNVSDGLENSLPIHYPPEMEWYSRLIAVPKTQKGPRLIAAEPTCNQWIQQAIARWLRIGSRGTLIGTMVDFFDQTPSREAALAASITGSRSTIDLKSASDRLTCTVIQRIFRSNPGILDMLRACRTRYMQNTLDRKFPSLLKLRKFATQGSALTFPIQSIVFSILALGVGKHLEPRRSHRSLAKEVRVFGDDIIVPSTWVPTLKSLLERLWLKVNPAKTHSTGRFRESCGLDAFGGYDVTPAYVRSLRANALDARLLNGAIDTQNNFYLKGFWRAASFLIRTVPQIRKFPVVPLDARVPGLVIFNKKGLNYEGLYPLRFAQSLQRDEILLPVFRTRSENRFGENQGLSRRTSVFRFLHGSFERDFRDESRQVYIPASDIRPRIHQSIGEGRNNAFLHQVRPAKGQASETLVVRPAVVRRTWVPLWDVIT
jgi:hypothetical protein